MPKKKLPLVYPYNRDKFNPPAPVLAVSITIPIPVSDGQILKSLALMDSGADITVIPNWIVKHLQLKYVDEVLTSGYDGVQKNTFVYSVKIIFDNFGDFITRAIVTDDNFVLIGRDILNKFSLLLKGPSEIFKIS